MKSCLNSVSKVVVVALYRNNDYYPQKARGSSCPPCRAQLLHLLSHKSDDYSDYHRKRFEPLLLPLVRTEYTGKNPRLVKGFDRVKMSQKTRWIGKRLNRVLYGALRAILVNISSYGLHNQSKRAFVIANQLTQPTR